MRAIFLASLLGAASAADPAPKGPCAGRAAAEKPEIDWVSVPAGRFTMSEGPLAHAVKVRRFKLSKAPITTGQYCRCVAAGACEAPEPQGEKFDGEHQPVVGVDWTQAAAFARWVGARLPSEAEWEFAARGGPGRAFPWGDEEADCGRAVMNDPNAGGAGCGRSSTWPVCSKPKGNSPHGLCDLAGNVGQWVQDVYQHSFEGAPTDGSAWESTGTLRVMKGGSWSDEGRHFRAARRHRNRPGFSGAGFGFRLAL